MSFNEQYKDIYNLVKSDINIINNKLTDDLNLSDDINNAVKNFLSAPAKRIRIVVSILYLKMCNVTLNDNIYSHLSAIEIIHNASLIHDDVIDDDKIRRNNTTLNCEYNNKLAVIIGDYLLSIVLEKLNKLNNPILISMYAETLQNMCKGETNQYFNIGKITSIEKYIEKTEQKTASLFQAALLGSLAASDKNNYLENAADFSKNFGIAFQIRDDILNISQKDKSKSARDIEKGIYNAPVILGGSVENLDAGIEKTRLLLENYIEEGKKSLEDFENNKYKQALFALLELLKYD